MSDQKIDTQRDKHNKELGVWFPAVRTGTGTDVFTERLVKDLNKQGIKAEITWLPLRAEYSPWTVAAPKPPEWATIVHVNTWLHSRFLPKNLPLIATLHHSIHDPALRAYKGWLRAAYHRWWIAPNERRVLQRANHVTAVSQFVADMAQKTLCDVPMQVIYNGIDTNVFCPGKRVRQPGEPFRLLYIGAWRQLKGVDLLAPIMDQLGDEFELHYTGGLAAEKDKIKMPSNMYDLGRLSGSQVVTSMQNSDAFLFPSRSEGFGLAVAEAMACGLPVIATRGSSLVEIVTDGENGWLCPKDEIASFVSAARRMLLNNESFSNMKKKAAADAQINFNLTTTTSSYHYNYKSITGNI